jgi:pyruvate,water dikinase
VDPTSALTVPLAEAARHGEALLGGKAVGLGRLIDAGYTVPDGFCITVKAYDRFVAHNEIEGILHMELERKPLASMRWEEIWDAALRIRSAFLAATVPDDVAAAITHGYRKLAPGAMVVRSSAPGEDSSQRSYAGLHESLVGVVGEAALIDAIRVVWSSLWSDAALLYRQELGMNTRSSRMAVVVQTLVKADTSGVGFGVDPRTPESDREVIEAVPGPCEDLVSGAVDPDRWIMKRSSGEVVEWRAGERDASDGSPILQPADLELLHKTLHSIESILGCPADVEWTGRSSGLTLLQARPVTRAAERKDDEREWYLTLRPGRVRLDALCTRVTEELIPRLERETRRFADENIEPYDNNKLSEAIEARDEALKRWKKIYWDEFIPFAHGVRQLGLYYNDAVRPEDPYEFVGLLRNQPMIASQRNAEIAHLASFVRQHPDLQESLQAMVDEGALDTNEPWEALARSLAAKSAGAAFIDDLRSFLRKYMDVAFDGERLDDRPDLIVRIVLELAAGGTHTTDNEVASSARLEQRLLDAVGGDRRDEALDVLRVARLSWRLRDDDNILIGRLENQVQRALELAAQRLQDAGRLDAKARIELAAAGDIVDALGDPGARPVRLSTKASRSVSRPARSGEKPRQLIGQPASPGCNTGRARIVRHVGDIAAFRAGEVIVCDAIQPTMTHLLPLASAVVERRGGMLIHGAIIARELGIPCVNGVVDATEKLDDGELVTVDGHLGIVTVGPPEFDIELGKLE